MRSFKPFPSWRWNPDTGEGRIFNSEAEVPTGWLTQHPNTVNDPRPVAAPKAPPALPMTRDEITVALDAGGIQYRKNANIKALYDLLVASLEEHLDSCNITYPDNATAPQLLALIPKQG